MHASLFCISKHVYLFFPDVILCLGKLKMHSTITTSSWIQRLLCVWIAELQLKLLMAYKRLRWESVYWLWVWYLYKELCELLSQEATEKWNKKGTKYKDFLTNGIQDTASLLVSTLWVGSFGLLYNSLKVWEAWEACKRKSFSSLSVSTCAFPTIKSTPKDSIRREWNQIECDRQGNEVHWRTHVYLCTPSSMPSNLILKAMFFIIIDYVKF